MTNDSKLGLLAGVVGVIVAAMLTMNKPASPSVAVGGAGASADAVKPTAGVKEKAVAAEPVSPAVLPANLATTPVARTRTEPTVTPVSRRPNDDDLAP